MFFVGDGCQDHELLGKTGIFPCFTYHSMIRQPIARCKANKSDLQKCQFQPEYGNLTAY
jgi:hypothetical protein